MNIEMRYGQLKEMVKVYVQIKNAFESGKVKKCKWTGLSQKESVPSVKPNKGHFCPPHVDAAW